MSKLHRYVPHAVVFITSMGIMIIELVASRLVSKYFGSSLYTWTGVIGVVLAGISLGNYLGGRLADRFSPRRLATPLLLAASLLTFLILALDLALYALTSRGEHAAITRLTVLSAVAVIGLLFFLPAAALGTISPVMAKYALQQSSRIGGTVGSIYAVSAIGSIVGTFLCGFVLIPLLGITTIVLLVGLTIAVLAVLMGRLRAVSAAWAAAVLLLTILRAAGMAGASGLLRGNGGATLYRTDSMYSHIEVRDTARSTYTERILILDGLIHNRYNPADPDELLYEYEQIFSALTRYAVAGWRDRPFSTLALGGGACIFPYYLERNYPASWNRIVEIDPKVIQVARRYFDAPLAGRTGIAVMDARQYLSRARAAGERYDLVFLDAFSSYAVPYHLTTREFTGMVDEILAPGGIFLVNIIDIFSVGQFLNAYRNTVEAVFPHVRVFVTPYTSPAQRATFVLAAGRRPIDPDPRLELDGKPVARMLEEAELDELRRRNGPIVLTDGYAPVENLIAPVFLRSIR